MCHAQRFLLHLLLLSDTTLADLNSSLVREEEGLVACRGLVATGSGSPSQGLLANELNDNQVCVRVGGGGSYCNSGCLSPDIGVMKDRAGRWTGRQVQHTNFLISRTRAASCIAV